MITVRETDGLASYNLGLAIRREAAVRAGLEPPLAGNDDELRQATEGPKDPRNFDCIRQWEERRS